MPQNDNRAVNVILNELDARVTAAENAAKPVLAALSLAANSITENAASGTTVGGILGKTTGSTLSLANDDGGRFAISGTNLVAGLTSTDYEAGTSRSIVLRETLAGATNSPRDTPLAVGVINVNEQPSLRALLLSSTSLTIGTPASGAITEAATGSTISASGLPSGFTINGPARTWAYDGSGPASTPTVTLTETLGDSPNSPRATQIGLTVAAAAPTLSGMPALQAKRNAGQRAILGMIGTSMTSGWGSGIANGTGDGADAGRNGNSLRSKSWPQQLAAQLIAAGVPTRSDAYFSGLQTGDTVSTLTTYNPRVSFGAGWEVAGNESAGGKIMRVQNGTGALTFTPEIAADRFDILVTGFSGLGTLEVRDSSGLLLTIDESVNTGGSNDVTISATSSAFRRLTASRSTPSTNPITIAPPASSNASAFVVGIIPYDTTSPRLEIINIGWPGSRAYGTDTSSPHWNSHSSGAYAWYPFYAIGAINADAFFIELGHNDIAANTSAADYQTALTNIANQAKAKGANVALVKGNTATLSSYNLPASYLAAVDSVTSSLSLRPVLNFNSINLVTADRFDGVHLSGSGYAKDAAAAKSYLN